MRRWLSVVVVLGLSSGCGGSSEVRVEHAPKPEPTPEPAPEPQPPAEAEPATPLAQDAGDDQAASAATETPPPPPAAAAGVPLPDDVDGGEISRATVLAVLSQGIGRFLQRVRAEPALEGGRFIGWRILSFPPYAGGGLQAGAVREGDTVLRVNGQSVERPEQFKNVWDSLATESQVVLLVKRAGKQGQVRYRIVDAPGVGGRSPD